MRRPLRFSQKQRTDNDNPLHNLPDDLVVFILIKLSSTASSPSDFINILLTCKRLKLLGLRRLVLSKLGPRAFTIKPKNWSESAHRFLSHCAKAGNIDASYILGMIRYYCLQNQSSGLSLMAKAAMKSHAPALYSLAVIQFNGSGGMSRDLRAGVALCARASLFGHIDALRELGYCFHDGYGVRKNVTEGRRLLIQANVRELAFVIHAVTQSSSSSPSSLLTWRTQRLRNAVGSVSSLSGYNGAVQVVNWFMREWFESGRGCLGEGLRLCSHIGCGRIETKAQEFRRCSVCGKVNYCSRGCQALDWKLRHKMECSPVQLWGPENDGGVDGQDVVEMGN